MLGKRETYEPLKLEYYKRAEVHYLLAVEKNPELYKAHVNIASRH
jgi:hypothetical protein